MTERSTAYCVDKVRLQYFLRRLEGVPTPVNPHSRAGEYMSLRGHTVVDTGLFLPHLARK